MAEKTIAQLESELVTISEKTRDAYDVLNDDRNGLYTKLGIEENTLTKKGLLPGVKEKAQARIKTLESEIRAAEVKYNRFQTQKNNLNKELKDIKKLETEEKTKKATAKGAGNVYQEALTDLKNAELGLQGYKGNTKYQDAYRKAQAAYDAAVASGLTPIQLGPPRVNVPPIETEEDPAGGKVDDTKTDSISAFIATLANPANSNLILAVQQDLAKNFNYKGPVDGLYSLPLQNAIDTIATSRKSLPENLRGTDFRTFLADSKSAQLLGISATGADGGSGGTKIANYISDPTAAAATVNTVISRLLGREATSKEVKDLSAILIDAQRKNPYKTTNGIRVGGLDDEQLLTNVIQSGKYAADKKLGKLSTLGKLATELSTKKADKRTILGEDIMATANANGISLTPAQLNTYTQQVQNGTDINIIKRAIRSSAALGLPDNVQKLIAEGTDLETIFSPYRNTMAAVLEINPDSISLTDPTLRQAFGPDKELPLYEFQRQLRKDARWQYTNNAREEVSNAALGVLRDFGFQG
jgi:hypothetical protein